MVHRKRRRVLKARIMELKCQKVTSNFPHFLIGQVIQKEQEEGQKEEEGKEEEKENQEEENNEYHIEEDKQKEEEKKRKTNKKKKEEKKKKKKGRNVSRMVVIFAEGDNASWRVEMRCGGW